MQHTKTCRVTYLPTNNYGVLYFPLSSSLWQIQCRSVKVLRRYGDFSRWRPPPSWIFTILHF